MKKIYYKGKNKPKNNKRKQNNDKLKWVSNFTLFIN